MQNLIKFWAGRIEEFYNTEKENGKGKERNLDSDYSQLHLIDDDNQFLFLDLSSLEIEVLKNFEKKGVQAFLELFDKKYDTVSGPLQFAVFFRHIFSMFYMFTLISFNYYIFEYFFKINCCIIRKCCVRIIIFSKYCVT